MTIMLKNGDARLVLSPTEGGCVERYTIGDRNILRPLVRSQVADWDARSYAAFPLFPFCGRIRNGQFFLDGRQICLPANMPPEPHAIHGHAWQEPWKITASDEQSAELSYDYSASEWPWSYKAVQRFELAEHKLTLTLALINQSASVMPAGFGWHPYFERDGAELSARTTGVWQAATDDTKAHLAALSAATDLRTRRPVQTLNVDHCFDLDGVRQTINWPDAEITMTADPIFTRLTVFVPPGEDFFCVEPISHVPDAVNMDLPAAEMGLHLLAPGEAMTGKIELAVTFRR